MLVLRKPIDDFLGFVFPPACRICRARLENGNFICPQCEKLSSRLTAPFCAACKQVLPEGDSLQCPACAKPQSQVKTWPTHMDCPKTA